MKLFSVKDTLRFYGNQLSLTSFNETKVKKEIVKRINHYNDLYKIQHNFMERYLHEDKLLNDLCVGYNNKLHTEILDLIDDNTVISRDLKEKWLKYLNKKN